MIGAVATLKPSLKRALQTHVRGMLVPLCFAVAALGGCATAGGGSNPPLPNGPASTNDGGGLAADDDSGSPQGDDTGDDGSPGSAGDDASPTASNCDDALHGIKALFVIPPVTCTTSSDCAAGSCCFVGSSASTCVMQ
jgi:hypothetical protein